MTKEKKEKEYGSLRCSPESVPRFKTLAPQTGFTTMISFLDALSKVKAKDMAKLLEEFSKEK